MQYENKHQREVNILILEICLGEKKLWFYLNILIFSINVDCDPNIM